MNVPNSQDNATSSSKATFSLSARQVAQIPTTHFCPACFWIEAHYEPWGFPFQIPMPGVFKTIDAFSKNLAHACIDKGLPLPKGFPTLGPIKRYANTQNLHYKKFQRYNKDSDILLRGSPDDLIILEDNSYHIFDYKTSCLTTNQEALLGIYEGQLNVYAWIAEHLAGRSPSGIHLLFFHPIAQVKASQADDLRQSPSLSFAIKNKPMDLNTKQIPSWLAYAREVYDLAQAPSHTPSCKNATRIEHLVTTYFSGGFQVAQVA